MNKFILCNSLLLLCAACSVGPDYKRPNDFDADKTAAYLELKNEVNWKPNPEWYKSFGDEDLNNLIATALENSPDIKNAIENMHQARYQLYIDRAGFLPTFDAQGSYNKSDENLAGLFPIKSEYYQLGADASWELDIWGGQRRLTESASAMLKAAAADFDNVKISLTSEIASNYINWRLAEKMLALTEKNLQMQQEIFDIVNSQYEAGLADDLAYKQAQSILDTTKMQLPQIRTQEKAYQNALAVLVGKMPYDIVKTSSQIPNIKPSFEMENLDNLPVDVIRNRPDVRAAEEKLIAQNALIGKAVANLFPSVSLSAFLGYQNKTLSPIFGADYNMYNLSGAINMPLLHWGELINQVNLQKSATKQALATYQATLITAVADISNAKKSLMEEEQRNLSAKDSMEAMQEILDLSLTKYQNGLIDFSDLLTAEQNKLSSEQEYLNSNASLYLDIINFYKAIGGAIDISINNQTSQTGEIIADVVPYKD